MKPNPKTHDSLFKWLIASFTREFFAHYFPDIGIGKWEFIDKEFVKKYERLKESIRGDLFLIMETEIDGELREIVIQIEHQSKKEDVSRRVFEYACYAWLLRQKPIWSIVIYTDDAVWRKPVPDAFWYGFDAINGKQTHHFDVIKVKAEKSGDLIKKHSLLCKLLALKANDRGTDPEHLIREIYRAASEMKDILTNDQHLLVERWVDAYKKVPKQTSNRIKKEVSMEFIATTITEHIQHESKIEGKIEGKIEMLENMYIKKMLSKEQFEEMVAPLRKELAALVKKNQENETEH
ncbi:hypothetical protein [Desulfonema magnum]|uniref:Transposase (putative) YhgA-like domain-containing protein n=1 Tax=Desulfonema magnum TaxID=45655 RepID=A0A975BSS1_9BACT|nr:hypothetical protein [Desulfonema magnum]QTA90782.1 Uncharacterized protein dnm_068430 [Desulfonema magnum]